MADNVDKTILSDNNPDCPEIDSDSYFHITVIDISENQEDIELIKNAMQHR